MGPYPTEAPPAPEPHGARVADDELAVKLRKARLEQGQGEVLHGVLASTDDVAQAEAAATSVKSVTVSRTSSW